MNQVCIGDGVTGGATRGVMIIAQTIRYTGAAWEVMTERGMTQQSNITLTWEGANNRLKIDLSGMDNTYAAKPMVMVTAFDDNVAPRQFTPQARCTDADTLYVKFYDDATAIGPIETSESTGMVFSLLVIGKSL